MPAERKQAKGNRSSLSLPLESASPTTSGPVTTSVTQHVKRGREKDFETWLQGVYQAAAQFPGHQSITIIRPSGSSRDYTYIFRFDSYEHLRQWETSAERDQWVDNLTDLIEAPAKKQILTGLEYWFTLPGTLGRPAPPRYKIALLTIPTIYILTTILGLLATPGSLTATRLLKGLAISVTSVILMTYVLVPRVTRLFASWLFPKAQV